MGRAGLLEKPQGPSCRPRDTLIVVRKALRKMKFSANLSFLFQEHKDLKDRYKAAKKAGFQCVETGFPYSVPAQELAKLCQEEGLQQVLINTFPGDNLGFGGRVGEEGQFLESLKRSLEYCTSLDCHLLHIMAGRKKEGVSRETALMTFKSNLEAALPLLKAAKVVGLSEPINPYSVPNYNMDNYEDAVHLVKDLDSPWLTLQLDIFHLQQIKGNITRNIKDFLPIVGHVQIAQVPGRGEPDSAGEVNYRNVLATLDGQGYQGWVGLEYTPVGNTEEGLQWVNQWGYEL